MTNKEDRSVPIRPHDNVLCSEEDVLRFLQQPPPYDPETARKVLGDPWQRVEGSPISQEEIVQRLATCRWQF